MTKQKTNSQRKKDVKTLSNLASGDTKQGGSNTQDDIRLQYERSASLPADNHSDTLEEKTQEELSAGNEMFQKGYKAGFDRGKFKARKEFLEIIDEEIKDEENAKKRNAVRNWYWDDELRLLKQKIKELQNSGAKDEK